MWRTISSEENPLSLPPTSATLLAPVLPAKQTKPLHQLQRNGKKKLKEIQYKSLCKIE
jgi:hypothetical protein